jgi:hypothetical protein
MAKYWESKKAFTNVEFALIDLRPGRRGLAVGVWRKGEPPRFPRLREGMSLLPRLTTPAYETLTFSSSVWITRRDAVVQTDHAR